MIENQVIERPEVRANEPLSTAQLLNAPNGDRANDDAANRNDLLFPANESENFRSRWQDIQGSFVDEPRRAVEQADQLVATVVKRLAEVFAGERNALEHEWSQGQDVSTEDLRQALRRYRSFFDRLLSV